MKVLIIGATGYLGPHVVKALEDHHQLLLTDIKPPKENTPHPFERVDVSSMEQVQRAAEGMDAILNLSVLREHRRIAFDVNARGCYNIMRAAVDHGIRRVINTGPHFTITGPLYEGIDHGITPDVPPHPSTILYALTKSLGQEICRVFSQHHDVYVLDYLFYNFRDPKQVKAGLGRSALHRLLGRRRRGFPPWPGDRTSAGCPPAAKSSSFPGTCLKGSFSTKRPSASWASSPRTTWPSFGSGPDRVPIRIHGLTPTAKCCRRFAAYWNPRAGARGTILSKIRIKP